MLHIVYILAFTLIAVLAISNLIRSLVTLGVDSQRVYPANNNFSQSTPATRKQVYSRKQVHPELLDEKGKVIEEPLLVMRSVSVEDARQQLDALYDSSPTKTDREE
ncbi:MAG: DUF2973 domain-containing protein [Xenococcaceae cyanobacterium]